ncbi:MAG: hypothetical protein R3181_12295, partial [Rubricoccaceae bacterium]|nr:hypothetical protein [Rubricoccaceae bacterium]
MTTRNRLLLAACVCFAAGCGGSEPDADGFVRESGTLSGSDEELVSGEFADDYTVSAQPGEWIEVAMTSSELDPYVILRPPSCPEGGTCETQVDNDDFVGGNGAFVWHEADEAGRWTVIATSAEPGEEGAYEVAYRVAPAGGAPATPGVALGSGRTERGELADGDATLGSQEYVDTYGFVGRAGEGVSVDLRSSAFDPYLILQMPGEDQLDNDDWEGARDRARIEHT